MDGRERRSMRWREMAEEARAFADQMTTEASQAILLQIAEQYETLANTTDDLSF